MNRGKKQLSKSNIKGFTLIELMIGLIIIAIGMSIAVPSFQGMVARNRIATQVNDMLLAVNLARSEASTTGGNVSIQALSPSTNDEFSGGWCVIPGRPGDAAYSADCSTGVIRRFGALAGTVTFNLVSDAGLSSITFSPIGGIIDSTTRSLDLCLTGQPGRRVFITPIGRAKSYRPGDTIEPSC
ncbi:MAG: type IV fimbrial biogenesis protein FimT [Candidatus Azotimanducaceae bacterium]|jgi:type IV fimbrial biogenesis protein FimT